MTVARFSLIDVVNISWQLDCFDIFLRRFVIQLPLKSFLGELLAQRHYKINIRLLAIIKPVLVWVNNWILRFCVITNYDLLGMLRGATNKHRLIRGRHVRRGVLEASNREWALLKLIHLLRAQQESPVIWFHRRGNLVYNCWHSTFFDVDLLVLSLVPCRICALNDHTSHILCVLPCRW